MDTPVLFLVFNRPDSTRLVFEAIRSARPSRLYVAADGSRASRDEEVQQCAEVRKISTAIDWPCELHLLFRDENLGCKKAVSEAITWFFDHEEEGIILEDDCLPDPSFFEFCEELLEKYRYENSVMAIGGNCFFHKKKPSFMPKDSYYFSKHVEIWGWATWRRAWKKYDGNISNWSQLANSDWLYMLGGGSKEFSSYWRRTFEGVYRGEVDTWDSQWVFSVWFNNGLSILPTKNLVANIGFNENATHTKEGDGILDNLPMEQMKFPLDHPSEVQQNHKIDRWLDSYIYNIGISWPLKFIKLLNRGVKFIKSKT